MILAQQKILRSVCPGGFFGLLCKVHQGKERLLRRKRYERRIKKTGICTNVLLRISASSGKIIVSKH